MLPVPAVHSSNITLSVVTYRILLILLSTLLIGRASDLPSSAPRYLFFNIAPDSAWNQNNPESFTRKVFDEVTGTLQVPDNPRLRVGLSFIFNTMETPTNVLAASLRHLLASSEEAGVPVLVTFDGANWWQRRSDLWNWWDPDLPGYNPSNRFNVEWSGWGPEQAVKLGWRDWGRQHRVAPAPNLSSPAVLAAHTAALRALIPLVEEWRQQLSPSRRWLFGGLKLGWEASIGYNAYYYPDGNQYVEHWPQDESHDPTNVLAMSKGLNCGVAQIGYAAVKTAGLKAGGALTGEDLGRVVGDYLEKLCRVAHECGLPADLVFTHQGGVGAPWEQHLPFRAAFNRYSTPGWSFYGVAPDEAGPLAADLQHARRQRWAAAEWWWGGSGTAEWKEHFRRTLAFRDCRFICVYNWNLGMFERQSQGQEAVRDLVREWAK